MSASAMLPSLETVRVTFDVPAHLAERIHALPSATLNQLLTDALDAQQNTLANGESTDATLWDDYDPAAEPIDEAFIAELIAADEETKRVGTIAFEDYVRLVEADSGPGFLGRLHARQAAGQTLGWDAE